MSDYKEFNNWNLPFRGGVIRSQPFGRTEFSQSPEGVKAYFGKNHEGHDTYSETTNEVRSVCDGVVIVDNDSYTGVPFPAYGNVVIIKENGTNRAFYYCHLESNKVNIGQEIKRGDVIAIMGGSGFGIQRSFGPHLHLALAELTDQNTRLNQDNGTYGFIDPEPYLIKANNEYNYPTNSNGDINPNQTQQPMQDDIKIIVQECIAQGLSLPKDKEKIAYILATAKHESDNFATLEEYASGSAYEGRADLGNTQPGDGVKYKGRGYVQITGRKNNTAFAAITGKDLVNKPELVQQDKSLAAFILVYGMVKGTFTGKSLDSYPYTYTATDPEVKSGVAKIGEIGVDFWNARRIVNGTDKADLIAGYANEYLDMINKGSIRVITQEVHETKTIKMTAAQGFTYITALLPEYTTEGQSYYRVARFDVDGAGEGLKLIAQEVVSPLIERIKAKDILIEDQKGQIERLINANKTQGDIIKDLENKLKLAELKSNETHFVPDPTKAAQYEAELERIKQEKINLLDELQKAKEQAHKQELEKDPLYQKATNGNLFSSSLKKVTAVLGTSWIGLSSWFASNGIDLTKISHDPICQGLAVYGVVITLVAAYLAYKKYQDNKKIKEGYGKALQAPSNLFDDISKLTTEAKAFVGDVKNAQNEFVSVVESLKK